MASYKEYQIDKTTDWAAVKAEQDRTLPLVNTPSNPNASKGTVPVVDPNAAQTAQNKQNWKELLKTTLNNWGLSTLIPKVQGYIDNGYTSDTALLMIQNEPEYLTRFSGNAARIKAGLSPLNPATYLATEDSYRAAMRAAGLPVGFYDDPVSDFSNFIANDVSPTELNSRIDIASNILEGADPMLVNQIQAYYGLDKGAMLAHILDPKAAVPFVNQQIKNAQMGVMASRQGVNIDVSTAQNIGNLGLLPSQTQAGFQKIAQEQDTLNQLSSRYGETVGTYGQEQAIAETFGGQDAAQAAKLKKKLIQTEQGQFAGSSGTGKSSFAQQQTGQL
jgi:hypothetical protein